jgi:hypothetical protein
VVQHQRDTLDKGEIYFFGKVSDDHGVSRLNLVYYKNREGEEAAIKNSIPVSREVYNEFFHSFPGEIVLDRGEDYSIYFEVFDNDGVNGSNVPRVRFLVTEKKPWTR